VSDPTVPDPSAVFRHLAKLLARTLTIWQAITGAAPGRNHRDLVARNRDPSPDYLHDYGGLQGTGGDSRGIENRDKATHSQGLVTKVVRHQ